MAAWLWVFLGGGLGSMSRYGISRLLGKVNSSFPFATLAANILACILLGFLVGLSLREELGPTNRLFLMTGFCGGFSTFSTFSSETWQLFESGHYAYALGNIGGSVLLCLFAIFIGLKLAAT
ncbi:MAG: fluoride efflux transporter CrcB [Saprospiraceae bacterium]|nr:fluoride efflux transporter CrcB [Saprospiraceae bacterium]